MQLVGVLYPPGYAHPMLTSFDAFKAPYSPSATDTAAGLSSPDFLNTYGQPFPFPSTPSPSF